MKQYEAEQVVDRLKGSDSDIEYIKNLTLSGKKSPTSKVVG